MAVKRPSRRERKKRARGKSYQKLVALVVAAMDPKATVKEGMWVEGPDGRRDMDVLVIGEINGQPARILIECKDYDPGKKSRRVGIQLIDALDSKKQDLSVMAAILCSNSGFTSGALRKAKRKGIGAITILKAGDPAVKAIVEEEIYFRHVKVIKTTASFAGVIPQDTNFDEIRIKGGLLKNWISAQIVRILETNVTTSGTFSKVWNFKTSIDLELESTKIPIKELTISTVLEIIWLSQEVKIDAALGIYDYLRGRIKFTPGENQYILHNVDIYNGTPIDFIPDLRELQSGLLPGEVYLDLMLLDGLDLPSDNSEIPDLDSLILKEGAVNFIEDINAQ